MEWAQDPICWSSSRRMIGLNPQMRGRRREKSLKFLNPWKFYGFSPESRFGIFRGLDKKVTLLLPLISFVPKTYRHPWHDLQEKNYTLMCQEAGIRSCDGKVQNEMNLDQFPILQFMSGWQWWWSSSSPYQISFPAVPHILSTSLPFFNAFSVTMVITDHDTPGGGLCWWWWGNPSLPPLFFREANENSRGQLHVTRFS